MRFTPSNHYWIVGGSATQVYSSAIGDYVPVSNPAYVAWLASNKPTKIDTEANLGAVLAPYNLRPIAPGVLDGFQTTEANNTDQVQFKILFNHENRIRALAGQGAITQQQFLTAIKALI